MTCTARLLIVAVLAFIGGLVTGYIHGHITGFAEAVSACITSLSKEGRKP